MQIGRSSLDAIGLVTEVARNWWSNIILVTLVSAVFTAPTFILTALAVSMIDESATEGVAGVDSEGTIIAGFVVILLSGLLTAVLVAMFARIYRGEHFSAGIALAEAADKLPAIFMFTFVSSLLVGIALIIVPIGLWLIIVFSLGLPALMAEDLRGLQTIRRCFRTFFAHWLIALQVLAFGLIASIAAASIVGGLTTPGAGLFAAPDLRDTSLATIAIQIGTSALLAPWLPALATALYLETKGRDEGFPSI